MANQSIIPTGIKQLDESRLGIDWQGGHQSAYTCFDLRLQCQCAGCVNEWTGEALLKASEVPKDVHPLKIQGVGRYGIKINWSDGHNTGIFTFQFLRHICSCVGCQEKE